MCLLTNLLVFKQIAEDDPMEFLFLPNRDYLICRDL